VVPVHEGLAVDLAFGVVGDVGGTIAVGERRGVDVDLEGRARLASGPAGDDVEFPADPAVVVVGTSHHGQHLAGGRIDHLGGPVVDVPRAQVRPVDVGGHGRLRDLLHSRVERGGDLQPAGGHQFRAVLPLQSLEHVVDKPRRGDVLLQGAVLVNQFLGDRGIVVRLGNLMIAQHLSLIHI